MPVAAFLLPLALMGAAGERHFDLTEASTRQPYDAARGYGVEPAGGKEGFLFSVAAAEGNYRITVTFGDPRQNGVTTVKAESRRLMGEAVRTAAGETATRSFVVNVRDARLAPPPDNAPGGTAVRLKPGEQKSFTWDDKLTLEFLGAPAVRSVTIAPADVPTIYLVGDSTVTDQRAEPAASWGQMLPAFLAPDIAVANHAESGETMKSFITAHRLDKVLSRMRAGDWLLIQFGHNDQKRGWPQTYADPRFAYPAYLKAFIAEARARGATPVLVTSPERRTFDGHGRIESTLADYVAAVKRVAAEEKVPLIDLNAASVAIYQALGPERAPLAFNDGGKDRTHHNNYGAWLLARAVAEGMRGTALARHLAPGLSRFDPARPPAPEQVPIAPSLARSDARPAGN
ncbi:rhamnogalacturonan acetylesterase [Sphingomonas gilva]|uniref:Rhamnogalacturonan acetylesterase n=1 Tax=Sphingomonas gilva TaxID=2305907 RepID=A0A396RNV0_9SPHN|nr:rhamnogalacturonan acetylesterase [Sphingomonas gilva]RHW17456.1 rhamnogalacturonan acetylesterase [Sphingomonas gilva]